jgi:drug/metabolite transporter (DMT)-like permease
MEFLITWQFNLVAYLVSVVFFFQFTRIAFRKAKDDTAATLILQSTTFLSILVLVPLFPLHLPNRPMLYVFLVIASVFYAVNDRLQTPIRKKLQVSTYSILNQLLFIFLFAYGMLIYKEPLDMSKVFGIFLIVGANVALFYQRGAFVLNKYVAMGIIAAFALATAITIDVGTSETFNLPIYIALTLFLPGLFIVAAEKVAYKRIVAEYKQSNIKIYAAAGIAWAGTILFSLRSLQLGEVTTVVPLQSLSVILNVIVAFVFLKEREDIIKKFILACIAVTGVVLIV